ncbi:MAG TPA: DUF4230 domain-containing protein [Polyangia bacterium]|jgi:hypothetical protein|nr:DUF4230 domain-containing protein [Polyangia bacterium]
MRKALAAGAALALVVAAAVPAIRSFQRHQIERRSHTVIEAVRRVTQLATVQMTFANWQLRRDTKDLFGFIPIRCEKTVAIFYRGKIAAGFDLNSPGALSIPTGEKGNTTALQVRLPAATILWTDVPPPDLVVADGSICNRVGPDDYVRLHEDARAAVKRDAVNAGVLAQAEKNVRELITEIVRPFGIEAQVSFESAPLLATPQ